MATTTVRSAFLGDHECSAYCRDGRHARVVWVNPEFVAEGTEVASLRDLVGLCGLAFVHAELAREKPRPTDLRTGVSDDGKVGVAPVPVWCQPWLVVWEERSN